MEVIGDFAAYPEGAKGVQEATIVSTGPEGWAEQVFFGSTSPRSRTKFSPSPTSGTGTNEVTWTLVEGKMLRDADGAYTFATSGTGAPRSPTGSPSTSRSR